MRLTSNPAATHSGGTRLLLGPRGSAALMSPLEPPRGSPLVRLAHRAGRSQPPGGAKALRLRGAVICPRRDAPGAGKEDAVEGGICSHSVSETKKKRRMLAHPPHGRRDG
jgi:hypothetical protein